MNIYDFDNSREFEKYAKSGKRLYLAQADFDISEEIYTNGLAAFRARIADGSSDKKQSAYVLLDSDLKILELRCSCVHDYWSLNYCKHTAAMLYKLRTKSANIRADIINAPVNFIVGRFNEARIQSASRKKSAEATIHLVPYIEEDRDEYVIKFSIGTEKLYKVRSINMLSSYFKTQESIRYGKNCEIVHDMRLLDEESRKALDFIFEAIGYLPPEDPPKRSIPFRGVFIEMYLDKFCTGSKVISINDLHYEIYDRDPVFNATLSYKNDIYTITFTNINEYEYIGKQKRAHFISERERVLYNCTDEFSKLVVEVLNLARRGGGILTIEKSAMVSFYNSVLTILADYMEIKGIGLVKELAYPEVTPRLYLSMDGDSTVTANMKFFYGDKGYPAFGDKDSSVRDIVSESELETAVMDWFECEPYRVPPFSITGSSNIFTFLTEGIPVLENRMELYASEQFKNLRINPPMVTNVGIRPKNDLLEINIEAFGYTKEDMEQILTAYRDGMKFLRLKNGTFTMLNDKGIARISEIAQALNIPVTDVLGIRKVPEYRMLYLDGLSSDRDGLRIKYADEFKELMKGYKNRLTADTVESGINESIGNIMRDYQKYGFTWLRTMYEYGFGGILADDMGLGKTLQAIALIDYVKNRYNENINESVNENADGNSSGRGKGKKTFKALIVCPSSLAFNWQSEVKRFAPHLRTLILSGLAASRREMMKDIDNYDIVVTSYQTLARDLTYYKKLYFELMFVDEAQYIKNQATRMAKAVKSIKSHIRFALTGTPVENSLAELWSIFDYIMPGYLFTYAAFKKSFETPIVKNGNKKSMEDLQKSVSPFILRRMKKDVLSELPEKTETIMYADMESEQKKLYFANAASARSQIAESLGVNTGKIEILALLTRLRQLCCDPSLIIEDYDGGSAKLDMCMDLIESCIDSGHKMLLFSQFTSMLDIIKTELDKRKIRYYTITGATPSKERLRLVDSFNKNDVPIFLISLKAGGTGLNLVGADIVIHYDPWWNASAENQASDRVYRIGQKNNVQIYKLIVKNTIEEKIQELQQKKLELADMALSGEGNIMQMSGEDILAMLS